MVGIADKINDNGEVLIPLSPLDAVMNTYRVVVLYIYPRPSASGVEFDLNKLQRSFTTLVDEDYPVLVGKLDIDREAGTLNVKQSPEERQRGGAGIRFETNPLNSQTVDDAMASLSWEFMPKPRVGGEIIAVKCSLLADGGLAIGVDCSHVLFDGEAMFTFMKTWGQHYSGVGKLKRLVINHDRHLLAGKGEICRHPHPEFQTTPARPLIRQPDGSLAPKAVSKPPKTAQHVFHLSPSNMAQMKKMASGAPEAPESSVPHESRTNITANLLSVFNSERKRVANSQAASCPSYVSTLDAITALFAILISRARGHNQSVRISTAVNGRRRLEPPLPTNYAGNAVFHAISSYSSKDLQQQSGTEGEVSSSTLSRVAHGVRASILERDNDFMRDTIAFLASQSDPSSINDNVEFFFGPDVAFTCWANMGLYDAEFEGTRPSYASIPRVQCMDGFVLITETPKAEEGLDVLVCLECATMDKFKALCANMPLLQNSKD
ncbi:hypothetical protein PHYBOEH_009633 [Phytophthora boehmeriae]|uniref:Transferase n=1 Tax=Phytophthora boehmeriae TaxID=109152 RepID=A0A8T1VTD1_9STRA|nr:hypothetical protein PHYBOEH_009633 [Phytophthora boehmeriae]